ncbi:hypothetical protein ACGFY7_11030 [Streptomyces prunicolor]|uniref:hypothetical protein n=1 Tax=Streptomyces prunicolor TaxID=67348 RepID=UPI00370F940F
MSAPVGKVASAASYDVAAYRRLLDHGQLCQACVKVMCPEARVMWRAVKRRES